MLRASNIILLVVILHGATSTYLQEAFERTEEFAEHRQEKRQVPGSINAYLKTVLEEFKQQMRHGIPALKIPVLEPFNVPDQSVDKRKSAFKVKATVTQSKVTGLSKLQINKLDLNLQSLRFDIGLGLPKININGQYTLKGKIVNIFPVYGNGKYSITVTRLSFSASVSVTVTANGRAKLAQPPTVQVYFKSLHVRFENLLGGGSLGNVINNIISALGRPLFDKFRPKLISSLNKALFKVLNKQLEKIDVTKYLGK